jgi:hypothetical protein
VHTAPKARPAHVTGMLSIAPKCGNGMSPPSLPHNLQPVVRTGHPSSFPPSMSRAPLTPPPLLNLLAPVDRWTSPQRRPTPLPAWPSTCGTEARASPSAAHATTGSILARAAWLTLASSGCARAPGCQPRAPGRVPPGGASVVRTRLAGACPGAQAWCAPGLRGRARRECQPAGGIIASLRRARPFDRARTRSGHTTCRLLCSPSSWAGRSIWRKPSPTR